MENVRKQARLKTNKFEHPISVINSLRLGLVMDRRISTDTRIFRRNRNTKQNPINKSEIVFDDELKQYLIYSNKQNSIIVLGDDSLLMKATKSKRICVDGTFSRCPKTHYQLVTFHVVCESGYSFPCCFCLLSGKSSQIYLELMRELDCYCFNKFGVNLFQRPELTVSSDFETGYLNAIKTFSCNLKCCFFHYCQAIWKRIKEKGLTNRYIEDGSFRKKIRYLMTLPFLKENDIEPTFRKLESEVEEIDLKTVYSYYDKQWMRKEMINLFCLYDVKFRTNNIAEAYHSSLVRRMKVCHPPFYVFTENVIDMMQTIKSDLYVETVNPKIAHNFSSFNRITNLTNNYYNDPVLSLETHEFLNVISEIIHGGWKFQDKYEDKLNIEDSNNESTEETFAEPLQELIELPHEEIIITVARRNQEDKKCKETKPKKRKEKKGFR